MPRAARQRDPVVLKEYAFLLRAVATVIPATKMLYEASALLKEPTDADALGFNRGVCVMVAMLLGMPEAEPDLTERVLRNLP